MVHVFYAAFSLFVQNLSHAEPARWGNPAETTVRETSAPADTARHVGPVPAVVVTLLPAVHKIMKGNHPILKIRVIANPRIQNRHAHLLRGNAVLYVLRTSKLSFHPVHGIKQNSRL